MGLNIDLHLHTRRHSPCSQIDAEHLIRQAARAHLDGIVITEHHYQWSQDELDALIKQADIPGFLVLAAFEYASSQGDILIYGLDDRAPEQFTPGMPPAEAIARAQSLGGVCIAAHPTRAGMAFDEEILTLPLDAIEIQSVNLKPHEQRLAALLAERAEKPAVAASDAHRLPDVGRYATEFLDPIQSMDDLREAIRNGRFVQAKAPAIRTAGF